MMTKWKEERSGTGEKMRGEEEESGKVGGD